MPVLSCVMVAMAGEGGVSTGGGSNSKGRGVMWTLSVGVPLDDGGSTTRSERA